MILKGFLDANRKSKCKKQNEMNEVVTKGPVHGKNKNKNKLPERNLIETFNCAHP